ncbi:hypothetical protein [Clostridium sp. HBUAS56017]|nr:hypothetical protein [Clostridium sp. HBUAS56017]
MKKVLILITHSAESARYGTSVIRLIDGEIVDREDLEKQIV